MESANVWCLPSIGLYGGRCSGGVLVGLFRIRCFRNSCRKERWRRQPLVEILCLGVWRLGVVVWKHLIFVVQLGLVLVLRVQTVQVQLIVLIAWGFSVFWTVLVQDWKDCGAWCVGVVYVRFLLLVSDGSVLQGSLFFSKVWLSCWCGESWKWSFVCICWFSIFVVQLVD